MHPRLLRVLIYSCFFLSGATGLIYEVVWAKYLSLIQGGDSSDIAHLHAQAAYAYRMGGFQAQALAAARQALALSPRHPGGDLSLNEWRKCSNSLN